MIEFKDKTLVVGDVHGKIEQFIELVESFPHSIQLGDLGFSHAHNNHMSNLNSDNHKVVLGNHDDTKFLNSPHSLGEYSKLLINGKKVFTIRGAESIDKNMRVEGLNWWRDEEMSYMMSLTVLEEYERFKPDIVLSHTCPTVIKRKILPGVIEECFTERFLRACYDIHQPYQWFFGHFHKDWVYQDTVTEFICLNELSKYEI